VSPGARADAALPRTRPIELPPPLATIAGKVGRSLLLLSRRTTGCRERRARKALFFLVRKTLLRSRCYQSGPHRMDPTACRHPGWTTRSVSDLPSIIWVLPGHRAPGRRRVQAVPGFHPLPRRNPGGSPSCILPALVRWLVWSPGGEWNRQGCRRAGRAAGGRHGARAKRRRDVGGRLFRITQYRALRACLRES
jgi:hypothetical protein